MNPEKQQLLADLHEGRTVFLGALRNVTEELATRAPAPGRWSVLECAEHVAISEEYLFSQIMASRSSDAPLVNKQREAMIVIVGRDRGRKIPSPEVGRPTGRFSALAQAIERFQSVRSRTIAYVENCNDDLRCRITSHPLIETPVNSYEILLMIAAHPYRHAQQIEEIKAALSMNC